MWEKKKINDYAHTLASLFAINRITLIGAPNAFLHPHNPPRGGAGIFLLDWFYVNVLILIDGLELLK